MTLPRNLPRAAGLLLLLLAPGCAREQQDRERAAEAAVPAAPALTAEQMARLSPSAAVVDAFNAICAEPARNPVARQAEWRGFSPVPVAVLREEMPGAAFPADAAAWRGTGEVGSAVLLWDGATATCELRAQGIDPLVVEAEFAKLPQTLEEAGASVMRLQGPPARAGAPQTRQMLLVSPNGRGAPERARVLRLGDGAAASSRDALVMTAQSVAGARAAR